MLLAIFNIREYEKLLYGSVLDVKRTCLKLKLNLDMKSPRIIHNLFGDQNICKK